MEDRISNLPTNILHNILSRLPKKYATRACVLSKSLAETWSTFPILSFSDTKFLGNEGNNFDKRKKFLDYVDKRLLRFCKEGLVIKQFKLKAECFDLHSLSNELDLWLKFVSERGVGVIKLHVKKVNFPYYILPVSVFEANSLTKLVLNGRIGIDLSSIKYSMKFFSLKVLSLEDVVFSDNEALKHLISHCPLIEYIYLGQCCVLDHSSEFCRKSKIKSLCMCGLARLKEVNVRDIEEVCVDSPCLQNLKYYAVLNGPYKIAFDRCRNLRRLTMCFPKSTIITNKWFLHLFSKFPYLEILVLYDCQISGRINISSIQLKELQLSHCSIEKEVSINAPNLLLCKCEYRKPHDANPISFLRYSSQLKVKVEHSTSDLNVLSKLINNLNPTTVLTSFTLSIYRIQDAIPLQPSSLPPRINCLKLHFFLKDKSKYFRVIYGLLLSCCPTTISMRMDSFCCKPFIEFFYETLMGKNKDICYCHSGDTKCWWHSLKSVKVSSFIEMGKNVDLKTILDMMQIREKITFSLEF